MFKLKQHKKSELPFAFAKTLLLFLVYIGHSFRVTGKKLGSEFKGRILAVKFKEESECVSNCLERGNTAVFNFANLVIMSNEQFLVVYWGLLAHSVFSVWNTNCSILCIVKYFLKIILPTLRHTICTSYTSSIAGFLLDMP